MKTTRKAGNYILLEDTGALECWDGASVIKALRSKM